MIFVGILYMSALVLGDSWHHYNNNEGTKVQNPRRVYTMYIANIVYFY